ncbi:lysine-rich nucleolar protein 1 isoform X3 [Alosa sapidissima]|uniref:lysine-rich nucleolar protein 1 isoform X3 n=1 Tax=Alosa sapidissima TaxID=34773 RepID=UPI001C08C32D|nr:lysine-rich nucleolar protein 1 isoform X3 [Alosa sapidissima]
MAKDKAAVKDKKRDKEKKQSLEEVTKVVATDEEVMNKEGEPISTKKKKRKEKEVVEDDNEQSDIIESEAIMEKGEKKKKKKKKSSCDHHIATENRESNMETDIIVIEEDPAGTEVKKKKKKKKKNKLQSKQGINSEEDVLPDCEGGEKKKNGEALTTVNDCDISGFDSAEKDSVETLKKTKKKKKRKADENNGDIEKNGSENTNGQKADIEGSVTVEDRKKEKKKKRKHDGLEEDACLTSTIKQTEHKKEKKNRKDSSHVEDMTNTATGSQLEILEEKPMDGKTKKGKKKTDISEAHELENNHMQGEKKKQKKKKAKEVEPTQQLVDNEKHEGEATGTEAVNRKKRKKNKNDPAKTEVETPTPKTCVEVETPTPKKKKNISEESTPAKTVKKEESVEEHQEVTEVVFLSEKPGNQDEILINQERRLALQREIDEESQPKSTFGQWSTATFDSSDQQQKFLRLMGGFKKGNQPAASGVGRPNMALGKEEQQSLQQKLLGQFERAQNRRMDFTSKGAGLGFTAPSNKKFSIDVNASRSVKFDD